ncbi:MAG: hypothetical protein ABF265_09765, partial [Polaribacter sp.]
MSIKSVFFSLFLVAIITESTAQNKKSEWVIGTSFALAKFTDFQGTILGGSFINQSPRINISKYLFKSFTADVGFSTAIFDTQKYTTFDAVLRYDFGTSMHNVVP